MKKNDVTGVRFGKLVATKREIRRLSNGNTAAFYTCICDCGNVKSVSLGNLTSGNTTSCGCGKRGVTSENKRKPAEHVVLNQIANYYRRNAKTRGFEFNLTIQQIKSLVFEKCAYCGAYGSNTNRIRSLIDGLERSIPSNGIDRIDSSLGYTMDNCTTACKRCNQAKNNMTKEEFFEWIDRVHAFTHSHRQATTNG